MRKFILLFAAAALATLARPAQAGFVLSTDATLVQITENNPIDTVFQVGEVVKTADVGAPRGDVSGTFAADTPDTPADIVLNPLADFGYSLDLTVAGTTPVSTSLTGAYAIKQFLPGNVVNNVSSGTADLTLTGSLQGGGALAGTLTQTAGPTGGAPNITYGGAFSYSGSFTPIILQPGQELGLIVGRITPVAVPEPGSLALLGMGVLPMLGLARRRR